MKASDLVSKARKAAKLKKWNEADQLYKRAVRILAKQQKQSPNLKESYLSTKAEYLYQKPYRRDQESLDTFKMRIFNAIRYLNECSIISENSEHYINTMHRLVQWIIKQYGCVFSETKYHVTVSCPIQLRSDKLGSMGISTGTTYKKILCSICGLNMLDEECTHNVNQIYEGKQCLEIREGLQIKDISLVQRPKDPLCRITSISYPKETFLEKCGVDLRFDLKHKLGVKCTRCRDENIDPSLITPELFFKIHGLNISINKPLVTPTKNLVKNEIYIEGIVWTANSK